MYSPLILEYANKVFDDIIIPDEVIVSEGVACGDALVAQGEVNGGVLRFSITMTDGCLLSRAMAAYLRSRGSGRKLEAVRRWVLLIKETAGRDSRRIFQDWGIPYRPERIGCFLGPVDALVDLISRLKSRSTMVYKMKDTEKSLDCDACTRSSSVLWSGDTAPKVICGEKDVEIPDSYREKWCRVSKFCLDDEERALLHELASHLTTEDMSYIRHEKMAQCVFSNLVQLGLSDALNNQNWKILYYQIHRKKVVKREIDEIADFIGGIDASFIKGKNTGVLYEDEKRYRLHLDYDILCYSENAAWRLGCFLLRRGFLMYKDVFSLKKIDVKGEEVIQGHFHMQKILDDQFRLVIDVNFPGFPVGRIGLFFPSYDGVFVSRENQFVITLCHTFKHQNVFMKDLNDLYLMSTRWEMDKGKLAVLLQDAGLGLFASVALNYICSAYCVSAEDRKRVLSLIPREHVDDYKLVKGWPYSAQAMLAVKRKDLSVRKQEKRDNPRTYLMPLVMVSEPIAEDALASVAQKLPSARCMSKTIVEDDVDGVRVIVTGMGCFLDKHIGSNESVDRDRLRTRLHAIVQTAGIRHETVVPFAIAPKVDKWFF